MIGLRRLLLLAVTLSGLPVAPAAGYAEQIAAPRFTTVGNDEQIPEAVVTALAEDALGLLWIGTPAGLIRHDGYRFRRYVHVPGDAGSLGGNLVRSLLAASDGRLWIGTDVDGVSIYDPRTDRFEHLRHRSEDPDSLGEGAVFALAEDAHGRVWIATRGGGLYRHDGTGRLRHFGRGDGGLLSEHVNELLRDREGRLWIATAEGLNLVDADGESFIAVANDPSQPLSLHRRLIVTLQQIADGRLWLAGRDGALLVFDPASGKLDALDEADPDDGAQLIYDLRELDAGEVWVARSDGIEVRAADGGLLHRLRHVRQQPGSLAGNDVRALLRDRAGVMWVGGFGVGLQRHDPRHRAFGLLHGGEGVLADPSVSALLHRRNGELWLGTRGAGIAVLDAGLAPHFDLPAATSPADWITAFAEQADGTLWVGAREGLFRFDSGARRLLPVPTRDGAMASVRRLLAARDGSLWIGGNGGVSRRDPSGALSLFLADGQRLEGDINALVEDADGGIWAGSSVGLYYRAPDNTSFQRVEGSAQRPPLPPSVVGLLLDREGTLWVDTSEGLYRRRDLGADGRPGFEAVAGAQGEQRLSFGANLLEDHLGRIWTAHHVFDPRSNTRYTFTRADGVDVGTPWFRAYAQGADGRLWFGGSRGVLVVDPVRFRPWDYAPPVVLTDLRIDGQAAAPGSETLPIVMAPPQRQLSIEFAALDYSAPDRLRYRYRLHGYDHDWISSPEGSRVAAYGNLWPGNYLLEVQGSNRLGEWAPLSLKRPVHVLPAFWQTPLFLLSGVLAALLLVLGVMRWRSARADRRARRLQALVAQRTAELREEKERAEQALDQLQNAQQQLVAAEKMASLGQLVAGVAHEINTPIGIALTAASHLQDIGRQQERLASEGRMSRRDFDHWREALQEGMRLILGSLDRAHTLIASFKQVAVDQSSEQRRRIPLQQFLGEVRFALQPSYRRAGHTLDIDCPGSIELDSYPGALFQILTNLIANSQLHAYAEGQRGRLQISVEEDGESVLLHYRDDGRGMDSATAARAFEPFFTTRRGSGGSGLGLHLVYNLTTQLLGGSITLRSAPGAGCEFTLRLPRRAPERTPTPARAS